MNSSTVRSFICFCVLMWLLLPPQTGCKPADQPGSPATPVDQPGSSSETRPDATANKPAPKPEAPRSVPAVLSADVLRDLGPLLVPVDNPMTDEKIALGRKLYFDKRLSKDGTISCATCHDPAMAWAENRPTSKGIKGQIGKVNSPTVINAAYAKAQFWDGRAASLEQQAFGPIENPVEMGHNLDVLVAELAAVPEYEEAFQKVFGTSVTKDGIGKAIATFERTILSHNSPYDKFKAGENSAMTESQIRGLGLFEDVGCADCHQPPLFSSYRYYNTGVGMDKEKPDEGRMAVTKKKSDLGKFRVPALREVAGTGPYFHDGSVETLEAAVELMANGGKDNPNLSGMMKAVRDENLSEQDKEDIVEFLRALSGDYPRQ